MHLILLGPPGAGKGTQASRIEEDFEIPHIATGDMFRKAIKEGTPLGKKAKEYMDQGKLVPDEVTIGIVEERLSEDDCQEGYILDGFPRTVNQAQALSEILEQLEIDLNAAINIKVGQEEVVDRLSARRVCSDCGATYHLEFNPPAEDGVCDKCGGELHQRDDDKPSTIEERLDVYHDKTAPLVEYYEKRNLLKSVNGEQEVEVVFSEIKDILEGNR